MVELDHGRATFVTVDVNLNQDGEVTGRITREGSRRQVDMDFSFAGSHPDGAQPCRGTAKASGQLAYNTTVNSAANADRTPREEPGWALRLKAFDGFSFEACSPVRYATWTLTRKRDGA